MLDPHNRGDMNNLAEAVWDSRYRYQPFVQQVRRVTEDFLGPGFGREIRRDKVPFNRGQLCLMAFLHKLISGEVRTLHTSMDPQLEIPSLEREAAMNQWIIREKVTDQLRKFVLSGLVSPHGILKLNIAPFESQNHDDPGRLIMRNIGHDDWVQDMTVSQQCDWAFCGHRYRVPIHRVMQDLSIPDERLQRLVDMPYRFVDEFGNERISTISSGIRATTPYKRFLELWEIFLPEEQLVLTFVGSYGGNSIFDPQPLKIIHWTGPKAGPYHQLIFHPVHEQALGFPPVEFYRELHRSINIIGNKVIRDAEGYKRLLCVGKDDNVADIDAVVRSAHGKALALDKPGEAKEIVLSAPDQRLMGVLLTLVQQMNTQGGGYEQLMGINAPAPTATQDKLKDENASEMIGAMQQTMSDTFVRVFTDVSQWMFSKELGDPMQNIPAQRPLGDTGYNIPFRMTADLHQGDTEDYQIRIAPYSYKAKTPDEELQDLVQLTQLIAQWVQMAAQGAPLDIQWAIQTVARLKNSPFLARFWNPGAAGQIPNQQQIATQSAPGQGAQNQTTTHIRQDRGGPPDQGEQMQSMLGMMGQGDSSATPQTSAA